MAEVVKWILVATLALGSLVTISQVGKPRKTTTPLDAVVVVTINALLLVGILVYWGQP